MKNKKPKVIVILGQTATGKSNLAVKIAKNINKPFGCEIISADSRQIYKYMNIGTGKITKKEMKDIPHHLLSIIHPKDSFSVIDFKNLAIKKIEQIIKKNKIPIICGGTGFYIDTLSENLILPEVKKNEKLRKKLNKKNTKELFDILIKLDEDRARIIKEKNEINNKVRLIRAIEIATHLGKIPKLKKAHNPYKFIKIGIKLDFKDLKEKIEKRVQKMFQNGLLKEIDKLKKLGIKNQKLKEFGFEYYNPTKESVIKNTIKYAKRQKTWFQRNKKIKWFNVKEEDKILKYIKEKIT